MSEPISGQKPPEDVWVGIREGEWPIHTFTTEAHALQFLRQTHAPANTSYQYRPRLWKAKLILGEEMTVVNPKPYMVPKEQKTS